ncbi:hypothetical protein [Geodermatophilus sp. URMC 65]
MGSLLVIAVFFLFLAALLYIHDVIATPTEPDEEWRERAAVFGSLEVAESRQIQRLTDIASFTDAVIRVRANAALSAYQKLEQLGEGYSRALEQLANSGKLDPEVEATFRTFAGSTAEMITGLTADFGDSLHLLIRTYDGRYQRRLR